MKKYKVPFEVICTVYVDVEAEDINDAIDAAYDEVYLTGYVGNGGSDKLIGVTRENHTIEAGEDFKVIEDLITEI